MYSKLEPQVTFRNIIAKQSRDLMKSGYHCIGGLFQKARHCLMAQEHVKAVNVDMRFQLSSKARPLDTAWT